MLIQFKDKMPDKGEVRSFKVFTPEEKKPVWCSECKKSLIFNQTIPMPDDKVFIHCINENCLATEVNNEYWWVRHELTKKEKIAVVALIVFVLIFLVWFFLWGPPKKHKTEQKQRVEKTTEQSLT